MYVIEKNFKYGCAQSFLSMSNNGGDEISIRYGIEEKPPLLKSILLGLQHVSVMIVPSTAVAFIESQGGYPEA